jgi:hypothetical protein
VGCTRSDRADASRPAETATASEALIWPQFPALAPPTPVQYMRFGDFVDVDGDLAIVGAPTNGKIVGQPGTADSRPGQAFVFARQHMTPPAADTWALEARLVASDPQDFSDFGCAVAIDGDWAVVGADLADGGVGAVYVFHRDAPGTWRQTQKFDYQSEAAGLGQGNGDIRIGRSVGIDGNRFVTCSAKTDVSTGPNTWINDAGTVWIYELDAGSGQWTLAAELREKNPGANDQLGINCRISGDYVVAGAFQKTAKVTVDGGPVFLGKAGAAFIFERHSGTDGGAPSWVQRQFVFANDPAADDNFGVSVSIDGTTFVAGAKGSDTLGTSAGAAYLFDRQSDGSWKQTQKLLASDGLANDGFGTNVAISGGHVIIGAPGVDGPDKDTSGNLLDGEGAAYFFTKTSSGWTEERKVHPSPPVATTGFGLQVNIDGALGIVSSPLIDTLTGRAFLFEGVDATGPAQPCTEGQRCSTGYCEDGICCDRPCGTCQACVRVKTGQPDGTCAPIPKGTDPDNECTNPTCTAGVQKGDECDGVGACNTADIDCEPYVCKASGDRCNTSCTTSADCAADAYCDKGTSTCVKKHGNSVQCTADEQCTTKNCVDGVCCNAVCNGQCEACDVDGHAGTCTAVTGIPHGKRSACVTDNAPCAGTCDGTNRATCTYPGGSTTCAPSTCSSATEQPFSCDGQGACVQAAPIACGNYACGDTGCKKTCTVNDDCATGFICQDSACIPTPNGQCSEDKSRVLDAVGKFVKDCSPYFCVNGQCSASCVATTDCQIGFVCDRNAKQCKKAQPPPPSAPVGCFCRATPGTRRVGAGGLFAAVAALGTLLVRRRRFVPSARRDEGPDAHRPCSPKS